MTQYELCKNIMTDDRKRRSFDALIHKTFGLSFESWYQSGEWGEWNQPYTLYDGDRAIANITVNHMKALYQGRVRDYIQLGGVATAAEYRRQGLSRFLMETVQRDWTDRCDAMFLLANNSVTDFYPKFGFVEESQYRYCWKNEQVSEKSHWNAHMKKLDLSRKEDRDTLLRCYRKQNPFSEFQMVDNCSLLQFYCRHGMDQSIYYNETEDAVVIAEFQRDRMLCYDIYYSGEKSLLCFLNGCGKNMVREIVFLFTPKEKQSLMAEKYPDKDTHLFIKQGKENIFAGTKLYVPNISYT